MDKLIVIFCDILWHYVTFCDIMWHYVTFCDILWHVTCTKSCLHMSQNVTKCHVSSPLSWRESLLFSFSLSLHTQSITGAAQKPVTATIDPSHHIMEAQCIVLTTVLSIIILILSLAVVFVICVYKRTLRETRLAGCPVVVDRRCTEPLQRVGYGSK